MGVVVFFKSKYMNLLPFSLKLAKAAVILH